MKRNLIYFILYLFFMVSCSDDSVANSDKLVDIDILNFADIAISKGKSKNCKCRSIKIIER